MSKLSDDKREVLAYIDAILTTIEKYPSFNLGNALNNINLGASVNPFDFLLSIIKKMVGESEMIDWLVNLLTYSLPAIELGVKGILLSNLKQTIDCNNDPRIPLWLRLEPEDSMSVTSTINDERGLIFNIKNIDYSNLLSYSPLSQQGQMKYFGTKTYYFFNIPDLWDKKYYTYQEIYNDLLHLNEIYESEGSNTKLDASQIIKKSEINNIYELARAKDFNAFLWFIINKSKFTNNTEISVDDLRNYSKEYILDGGNLTKSPFANSSTDPITVLDYYNGEFQTSGLLPLPFSPGSTITQKSGEKYYKVLSLCIKETYNATYNPSIINDEVTDPNISSSNVLDERVVTASGPKLYQYQFVPVSSSLKSANWYVNSGTYFNFLKKEENRVPRDYKDDMAICNLGVLNSDDLKYYLINRNTFNYTSDETYIKFAILPAPLVHIPAIGKEKEPLWRFQKLLFNSNGIPSKKGKYSVSYKFRVDDEVNKQTIYQLDETNSNNKVIVDWQTGAYELQGSKTYLYECYPGLTVYDFNYNYVMGMQLFDPAVVASQLLDTATNIMMNGSIGINFNVNKTETLYQMRIAEIVKNIINSTAYEASDCFYSFSNTQFDSMLEKSELKRSQGYTFANSSMKTANVSLDDAYATLSEFSDNATLEENKEVINRSITTAMANITNEVLPEDKYNISITIVEELIKSLVINIVTSLLTPKIILLFEVNKQLMGGHDENLTLEDLLESLSGLITSIVIEIRDLILNELMTWAMSILTELIEKLSSMLVLEQLEYYTKLMKGLLQACSIKLSKRSPLNSKLDNVDYADIDPIEQPITESC